MKNNIDLLEPWLQYHFFIGFEHVYLIDNGSNPKLFEYATINNYMQQNKITYIHNPAPAYQLTGHNYVLQTYKHETQWMAFFDSDEFIVLKQHDTIGDFMKNYEDFASVSIGWYIFGSNNHIKHQPNLFEKYTLREVTSGHYKTIAQTKYVTRMNYHNVDKCVKDKITVDESKTKVTGPYPLYQNTKYIQLNHYIIRSWDDFQYKHIIGGGDGTHKPLTYFDNVNQRKMTSCDAILQFIRRINFKLNLPSYDHFKCIAQREIGMPNEKVHDMVNILISDPDVIVKIDTNVDHDITPYFDIINRFYPDRLIKNEV
jgi:hypothetical protein